MKLSLSGSRVSLLLALLVKANLFYAAEANLPATSLSAMPATSPIASKPLITPTPPALNAKAYILIDVNSGKIIAEKNSDERVPPASLTKLMTLYVISNGLHNEQIHLADN